VTMLELVEVTKSFGGIHANDKVSLRVAQGSIVGLIGPNGSGKTTLFNAITGVFPIDSGSIRFKGTEISKLLAGEIARAGIIRTFQQPRVYPHMSVAANMLVSSAIRRASFASLFRRAEPEAGEKLSELLDFVGLAERRDLLAGELSFGQQKLLELAMALVRRLQGEGMTILMVEHIVWALLDLSRRIIVLSAGEKIAEGSPEAVAADPAVVNVYLGSA